MKFMIALVLVAMVAARPDDSYSKFDNINEDEIIRNKRLLLSFLDCWTDTGKCTAQASELKELIPEGIQTSCAKCTEKEKPKIAKVMYAARETYPEKWNKLNELYNAGGKYDSNFEDFMKTYYH